MKRTQVFVLVAILLIGMGVSCMWSGCCDGVSARELRLEKLSRRSP